jgi:hypothetical protein
MFCIGATVRRKIAASASHLASPRFNSFEKKFTGIASGRIRANHSRVKNAFPLLAICLLASSCVTPATPQTRIQKNPEVFATLAPKEQKLVEQGEIAKGMSQDAVLLAWGTPANRFEGFKNGEPFERWDYSGLRPVYTNPIYGPFVSGPYRSDSPYGFSDVPYGFAGGPEVTYLPYRKSTAWFLKHRVDAWERLR